MVPIVIICYNNYIYLDNMITQLLKINPDFINNILIMNNMSTCNKTNEYLKNTKCKVINNNYNHPRIWLDINKDIYDKLPDIFITTDPDLEINKNIPSNFIEILSELSETYTIFKVGFAIDISDKENIYNYDSYMGVNGLTIFNHENQFWQNRIQNERYELYNALIDTTFCLYNKKYQSDDFYSAIRVAGNFTCKHLPWYKDCKLFNIYENYSLYKKVNIHVSSISRFVLTNVDENYSKIYKNQELFLIDNDDYNSNISYFNKNHNNDSNYQIFDKYLDKNKIMINFDNEIGINGMYFIRKSKHVYSVETNFELGDVIKKNYKNNCQSTSYTFLVDFNITNIINDNNINTNEISLINVNLNGQEENILNDLYSIHKINNIPLCISFNLNNWTDQNLERFDFLTEEEKIIIITTPNTYLVFDINNI